ncbi:MAG: hypothetical protein KBA06_03105, partial [Saprospiraceae bacterium]|nr:hypothetical protein [Saprospiraceae bacterium]
MTLQHKNHFLFFLHVITALFFMNNTNAQMVNGLDTLYGNEWINYSQQYYKIKVDKDGIYRISGETLAQAQIPIASIPSNQWQLFKNGKEVPIFVSTSSNLTATDFI